MSSLLEEFPPSPCSSASGTHWDLCFCFQLSRHSKIYLKLLIVGLYHIYKVAWNNLCIRIALPLNVFLLQSSMLYTRNAQSLTCQTHKWNCVLIHVPITQDIKKKISPPQTLGKTSQMFLQEWAKSEIMLKYAWLLMTKSTYKKKLYTLHFMIHSQALENTQQPSSTFSIISHNYVLIRKYTMAISNFFYSLL